LNSLFNSNAKIKALNFLNLTKLEVRRFNPEARTALVYWKKGFEARKNNEAFLVDKYSAVKQQYYENGRYCYDLFDKDEHKELLSQFTI